MESLFVRAGNVLNIDHNLLHPSLNCEPFQVVRYESGQKYNVHYDWGVEGIPNTRLLTLLIYLSTSASGSGGETVFPFANNGTGLQVRPKEGVAVLFYNLLEDGNTDALTLHSGGEVYGTTKWIRYTSHHEYNEVVKYL